MQRSQEILEKNRKLMESQIQLVLFAIELERQLEAHQEKDQILDDYRQKAIDMEEQHIHELDGLKEFFQKTVQEQTEEIENLRKHFDEEKMSLIAQLHEAQEQVKSIQGHRNELCYKGENLSQEAENLRNTVDEWINKHAKLQAESHRMIQELAYKHESQLKETAIYHQKDRAHLLNQFEKVRRKNRELEDRINDLIFENDELKENLKEAKITIESLGQKYGELEKERQREQSNSNDHIAELENILKIVYHEKGVLEDELHRKEIQLEDRISHITNLEEDWREILRKSEDSDIELERLNRCLIQKQSENELLIAKLEDLELENTRKFNEIKENFENVRKEDLQRVIAEKEKLVDEERKDFSRRLRETQSQFEGVITEATQKEEELKMTIQILKRNQEEEFFNLKEYFYTKLQNSLNEKQLSSDTELNELRNKISLLNEEIEKLDRELKEKNDELAKQYHQRLMIEREIDDLKAEYEQRKRDDFREFELRLSAERSTFETQLMQMSQKIEVLQQNNQKVHNDNIVLKEQLSDKIKELDLSKTKENMIDLVLQQELEEAKKQVDLFKKLYKESEENRTKDHLNNLQLESQLNQFRISLKQNRSENQRIYELMGTKNKENEELGRELTTVQNELANCKKECKDPDSEYHILNLQHTQLPKYLEEA